MKLSTTQKVLAVVLGSAIAVAAVVGIASTASAASYVFTRNLTVGATGADVMSLQQVLNSNPSTQVAATGAGSPGNESSYFGALTQAALAKFQAANGISPASGYFGPITRAFLNNLGTTPVATTGTLCPNGMTLASNCTASPNAPVVSLCPNGMTLSSNCTTAPSGTVTTPGTVVADGTDGSITASQSSYVSSGIQLKKGDTKDILAIRLQATAGPVTVTRADVHFNLRPWLIFSQLTLKDSTGKVLATKNLSSAADATEVTVGSDYLVRFDNISEVVTPGTNVDLIVGATVLGATDKITNNQIVNVSFGTNGLRTINGKGYTDSISGAALNGSASATGITAQTGVGVNNFTLVSTGSVADIFARVSPNTNPTRQVAVSTTQTTQNVNLGTVSLKSANNSSTLNGLTVTIGSTTLSAAVQSAFSNVRLVSGSYTAGGTLDSSGNVTFTNLNIPLTQDVWTDFSIIADVNSNITGTGITVSLTASTANIVVTDANYNTATVESSTATSNATTLTTNAVTVTSATASVGSAIIQNNSTVGYNVTYSFILTNTSNNDLYVSATSTTLATQAVTGGSSTASTTLSTIQTVSPSSYSGDVSGVAYVIPAGQSRSFTLTGVIRGTTGQTINLKVTSINYGTGSADASNHTASINFGLESLSETQSF